MNKSKTICVLGVILLFFGLTISSSLNAELLESNTIKSTTSSNKNYEEVIIYRYGLNGEVTPVRIQVPSVYNKDLSDIVADKCNELFENDKELKELTLNEENDSKWVEVKSEGKGFFFCFRPLVFKNRKVLWRTVLKCRYFYQGDYTLVRENKTAEWTPVLEDVHEIRIIGFTGYVYFQRFRLFRNMTIQGYTTTLEWRTPKWPRNPWVK